MNKKTVIMLMTMVCGISAGGYAAFKDSGWGARPVGMGGAFGAVADDVNALLYNPAGTAQLQNPEVTFSYARLFAGLDAVGFNTNYLAYGHPLVGGGAWAASWSNFISNGLYREDTITLNYAHSISAMYPDLDAEILLGGNLKYLRSGYTLDDRTRQDPVFRDGRNATGISVDLGALVNFGSESIGFSIRDINEPDMGLAETDRIPREYRLGACYLFGTLWQMEEALAGVDLTLRDKDFNLHIGWENFFLRKTIGIRAGFNDREAAIGTGYYFDVHGMGVGLDYTFVFPFTIDNTAGTHRMSLVCRFGGDDAP